MSRQQEWRENLARMAVVQDWVGAAHTVHRAAAMEEVRQTTPGPSKGPGAKFVINPYL